MKHLDSWQDEINTVIENQIRTLCPQKELQEVLLYACLPAGKLFRPMLACSLAHDLTGISDSHKIFACSLELHHTYTLIHDDLPAMDDDDMRRGRPATHKKYNEWTAILAGDSLLSLSYQILSQLDDKSHLSQILQIYGQSVGPNGLIYGQYLDLAQGHNHFNQILTIHELKTARLIQLALQGSNIIAGSPLEEKVCLQIGKALGINFQLLDDLCELTQELGCHEKQVNPFMNFDHETIFNEINDNTERLKQLLETHKLNNLREYINIYINKVYTTLTEGSQKLSEVVKITNQQIDNLKI